jgi:hypothetical protein
MREHKRYEVRIGAALRCGTLRMDAKVHDLAYGGLGIDAPRALDDDVDVEVTLFLVVDGVEDERVDTLTLVARVTWCTETDAGHFRCGLKLGELQPPARAVFDALLARVSG